MSNDFLKGLLETWPGIEKCLSFIPIFYIGVVIYLVYLCLKLRTELIDEDQKRINNELIIFFIAIGLLVLESIVKKYILVYLLIFLKYYFAFTCVIPVIFIIYGLKNYKKMDYLHPIIFLIIVLKVNYMLFIYFLTYHFLFFFKHSYLFYYNPVIILACYIFSFIWLFKNIIKIKKRLETINLEKELELL